MNRPNLTNEVISNVKKEVAETVYRIMGNDLIEIILYGSCVRGDFTNDSDIDIALLTKCNCIEA